MDSSLSSSSAKDASALQLAMAALLGASVMAVSAFYLHKRTVDQVLKQTLDSRRQKSTAEEDGTLDSEPDENGENDEYYTLRRRHESNKNGRWRNPVSQSRNREGAYYRNSSSMPDVTTAAWSNGVHDSKDLTGSFGNLASIPAGLPRLHTRREGSSQSLNHPGSRKRAVASVIRPTTPKSPVSSVFESVEDSDEEDQLLEDPEDQNFNYGNANGAAVAEGLTGTAETNTDHTASSLVPPDLVNAGEDQNQKSGTMMMRSHSISGDILAMHPPDPIAADILRKEPEQDNLVRLKITPIDAPTNEEEEVCRMMQECLALRDKYVFRENVVPWEKEIITNPSTPKRNPKPFSYEDEPASEHYFQMENGVVHVYSNKESSEELFPVADSTTFFTDVHRILRIISLGNVRTLCHHRLRLLEQKFSLHLMLNADREFLAQKSAPHRDFYNVRKVDTHVHHSACMNQKHLLRFIKSKLKKEPDEVVIFRDGKYLTLKEVFESLDLTGYDLNVDLLDVHADKNTFHRFDKFNLKYNPCGQSRLREIFLKQDNLIQGRFLAELTKQVLSDLEASKYQMAEYRISVYGRKQSEWDQLASWFVNNEIYSENAIWLIQFPRLYNVYKGMGIVLSFQNILDNIFIPLFEVTVDPGSHPQLHVFLKQGPPPLASLGVSLDGRVEFHVTTLEFGLPPRPHQRLEDFCRVFPGVNPSGNRALHPTMQVNIHDEEASRWMWNNFSQSESHKIVVVGFDMVDDESKPERRPTKHMPTPAQWTNDFNPAFSYYAYYCYANLYTLNKLRESKGMTTIKFRPHCGEAGDIDHLAAAFLMTHNIAHGNNLRKSPALQYLFYLSQIGLAMSPLSNNSLFLDYHRNPFPMFFARGLNVSLSTDDPLQIHLTKEPLVEEYSVAAQVWKLSACDLCEIARNSVYQSGFSHACKSHWVGRKYYIRGPEGNDIHRTNVPHMRVEFRHEVWKEERQYLYLGQAKILRESDP